MLDYIAFGVMLGCCVIQAIDIGVYSAQKNYKGWRLCVIALVCTAGQQVHCFITLFIDLEDGTCSIF